MSPSSLRASTRIAWRQARRATWRSALVLAMVALPISALTLAAVVIQTGEATPDERAAGVMGQAEFQVDQWSGSFRPARMLRELPAGSRLISIRFQGEEEVVGGTLLYLNFQEPSV
ncbi:MAG TPA: hypothetical protein VKA30_07780, partial [Actinomycetota bacterium]|nr:hypothetical protein [Actinomycetota bacterium]